MRRPLSSPQTATRCAVLGVASAAVLILGGCGGGGHKSTSTSSTATQAATTTTTTPTTPPGGSASVTTGQVRGTLRGENHAPKVNQQWRYTVTVSDAAGHPLSGTVDIEFTYGGAVVGRDTPPTHPVKSGRWSDNVIFPSASVGQPLTFRAVVHTRLGSITLDWPITVTQ